MAADGLRKLESILGQVAEIQPPSHLPRALPAGAWEAAVGPRIAARTRTLRLERGILYVRAATSGWASELSLLAPEILAKLGDRGVEASSLRFSVGQLSAPSREARMVRRRREPVLPASLLAVMSTVTDDELRKALTAAAARTLAAVAKAQAAPADTPAPRPGRLTRARG